MKTEIIPERLERFNLQDFHLRRGKGSGINGEVDACALQARNWLFGGDSTSDSAESEVIKAFVIGLNDSWLFDDEHRDLLKPFMPHVFDSVADEKRAFICADYAVRVFVPIWFRNDGNEEWAVKLESLPQIIDEKTARAGEELASAASAGNAASVVSAANAVSAARAGSAGSAAWSARAAWTGSAASAGKAASAASEETKSLLRTKSLECLRALIDA